MEVPGNFKGKQITIKDVYEAVGAYSKGKITAEDLRLMEDNAILGQSTCAGLYTANTMGMISELALPGSSSLPAVDSARVKYAYETGRALMHLIEIKA